jgi:hypothetical protein
VVGLAELRRRDEERVAESSPEPDATPELAEAWSSLQLHWLSTIPGYRELIKRRVDEAARAREKRTRRVEIALGIETRWPHYQPHEGRPRTTAIDGRRVGRGLRELLDELHRDDVDNLGREVEGCG